MSFEFRLIMRLTHRAPDDDADIAHTHECKTDTILIEM